MSNRRHMIVVITDMQAFHAECLATYGTDEDGRAAIPWRGRCPKPWPQHDTQGANYVACAGAFDPDEIAQAEQLPMLELYPADTGGFAQASAKHKNLPWHRLQWLSVDTDDCRGLCAVVAARRRKWQKDHPQAERSEP
jgi:hypothetical protein